MAGARRLNWNCFSVDQDARQNLSYDSVMAEQFPLDFIDEQVEVIFQTPPALEKSPTCPSAFVWRDMTYPIVELLQTWQDYRRRGRSSRNMREGHLSAAARRGSWGVGRFYFRVRIDDGRVFEIYYDRAPESAGDRKGHWYLLGERRA